MSAARARAIVLAAGLSSRMGELKPLLTIDGVPAVVRVAQAYADVGIEPLVVVGFEADAVVTVLDLYGVAHARNHEYETGMYSSVRRGVQALGIGSVDPFFVHPADCALVRAETMGLLARTWEAVSADVLHPLAGGRRGHPPLLAGSWREPILAWAGDGGLRGLLEQRRARAQEVVVDDPNVLLDMDDAGGYVRLERLAPRERIPDAAACRALLSRHGTPSPVVRHGEAVASAALSLGVALRQAGVALHLGLLEAAALTHDIVRPEPAHAAAGAELLDREGFPRVAAVVAEHMDLATTPAAVPGERELLFLADKLTIGARPVDLAGKLARAEERFRDSPDALATARDRLAVAGLIAARVEERTGRRLASVLA